MSDQTEANSANDARTRIKEEFAGLPLDKKLSSLFEMEVATISEGVSYVVNNSGEVFDKVGEVINDFSSKVQAEFKKATTSCETEAKSEASETTADETSESKPKGGKKTSKG
nr:hypothetical protein [uncultured bacterium]